MKITEKQIHMLIDVVRESLKISNDLAFSREDRLALVQEIFNQQSEELRDINQ
jgi:hypothetical protein